MLKNVKEKPTDFVVFYFFECNFRHPPPPNCNREFEGPAIAMGGGKLDDKNLDRKNRKQILKTVDGGNWATKIMARKIKDVGSIFLVAIFITQSPIHSPAYRNHHRTLDGSRKSCRKNQKRCLIFYWNRKIDWLKGSTMPKITIIWKKAWSESCRKFNFLQKTQWEHMSVSPHSGARELQRLLRLKYYNVVNRENRFNWILNNFYYLKLFSI